MLIGKPESEWQSSNQGIKKNQSNQSTKKNQNNQSIKIMKTSEKTGRVLMYHALVHQAQAQAQLHKPMHTRLLRQQMRMHLDIIMNKICLIDTGRGAYTEDPMMVVMSPPQNALRPVLW